MFLLKLFFDPRGRIGRLRFFLASIFTLSAFAGAMAVLAIKTGLTDINFLMDVYAPFAMSASDDVKFRDLIAPEIASQLPKLIYWGGLAFVSCFYVQTVLVFKRARDFREADTMAWLFTAIFLAALYLILATPYPVMMMLPAAYIQVGILFRLLSAGSKPASEIVEPSVAQNVAPLQAFVESGFQVRSLVFSADGRMNRPIYLAASLTFGALFFWFMTTVASATYYGWRVINSDLPSSSPRLAWELRRASVDIIGTFVVMGIVLAYRWVRLRLHESRDPKMYNVLAMIYLTAACAPVLLFLLPADTARYVGLMALPQFILMMMMSSVANNGRRRLPAEFIELFGGKLPPPLLMPDGGQPSPMAPQPNVMRPSSQSEGQRSPQSTDDLVRGAEELRWAEEQAQAASQPQRPMQTGRSSVPRSGFGRRQGLSTQS